MHLFTDGKVVRDTESASIGDVLCDQHENWIFCFNHYLRRYIVFYADLCGILDGLLMLLSRSFKSAAIRTNNLELVRVLQDNTMMDIRITVFRRVQQNMRVKG